MNSNNEILVNSMGVVLSRFSSVNMTILNMQNLLSKDNATFANPLVTTDQTDPDTVTNKINTGIYLFF
jgi:hypothetical protein